MYSNSNNGSRAESARGFMALSAMLVMGLGLMARPAEAAPFAYVANQADGTVSVIDTATTPNTVVATVTVGLVPFGVAVTPDGKRVYVANSSSNTVSVIDTTTTPNTVVATVTVGANPLGSPSPRTGNASMSQTQALAAFSVIDTTTTPHP